MYVCYIVSISCADQFCSSINSHAICKRKQWELFNSFEDFYIVYLFRSPAGACGLDLTKLEVSSLKQQIACLEAQVEMAEKYSKPVVVFEKAGASELLPILKSHADLQVIIHGFAGSTDQAKEYLDKG